MGGVVDFPESDVSGVPGEDERDWGIWNRGGLSTAVTGDGSDGLVGREIVPRTATSRDDLRVCPVSRPENPIASDNERTWEGAVLEEGCDWMDGG